MCVNKKHKSSKLEKFEFKKHARLRPIFELHNNKSHTTSNTEL